MELSKEGKNTSLRSLSFVTCCFYFHCELACENRSPNSTGGTSSTKRGLIPRGSGRERVLLNASCGKSVLFLQNYSSALESDADDANTLSSWPAVPPTPATPQVYPHLVMVTAVPV